MTKKSDACVTVFEMALYRAFLLIIATSVYVQSSYAGDSKLVLFG